MGSEPMNAHEQTTLDKVVSKVKLYITTLLLVGGISSGLTTWLVFKATSGVRAEVASLQDEAKRGNDRFDRMADIVELAVVALVEPPGSPEREKALSELRARRRITTR